MRVNIFTDIIIAMTDNRIYNNIFYTYFTQNAVLLS